MCSSQLVSSNMQMWEKASVAIKDSSKCKTVNLLNFHCNIKDKLIKKYIKYSKHKSHSIIMVHRSKDNEWIWKNQENKINLANDKYERIKQNQIINIHKRPSLYSYISPIVPNDSLTIDSIQIKFEDKNLFELIFTPKRVSYAFLNRVHSYLSIKYGISLEKGKYYDSSGKVLWETGAHKNFKYRPTGIGRDDENELYQKQSTNQADLFLTIGKNDIKRTNNDNNAVLDNKNFVIWSDDNKAMTTLTDGNYNVLQRNWEINFIGNTIPKNGYKVRIDKNIINPQAASFDYWIFLKHQDGTITKIQGNEENNFVMFNNINFKTNDKNSGVFTFATSSRNSEEKSDKRKESSFEYNQEDLSLDLSKIVLYPNPVKKGQNFTIQFPPMENLSVSIYDGAGRLLALDNVDRKSNHYVNHLSIQSVYIINLSQNGKIIKTFKLIVD